MPRFILFLFVSFFSLTLYSEELPLQNIKLPAGFTITTFAQQVPNARSMAWNGKDTLYVGTRHEGKVYALVDKNGDYQADQIHVIADDLTMPNGIVYYQGDLYVAEVGRIIKFEKIDSTLSKPKKAKIVYKNLPTESHHGWRYLNLGPDNKLYISIGAPCNICDEEGYARIARMNLDGSEFEVVASGVRNSVGFSWHPDTQELWFTDNGRDWMGDDSPPDELNKVTKMGQHFGYPYCHGGVILDPEFGEGKSCASYISPVQNLGAHVASLGVHIYSGPMFPSAYQGQVFIAEHGSWNRSKKSGYRISLVKIENNKAISYESFATGWLQGQSSWGRPTDIKALPDGSLLISDDQANAIYRITYQSK